MGFSRFYLALMDCICRYDSPLGGVTLAGEGPALTGLCFDRQAVVPPVRLAKRNFDDCGNRVSERCLQLNLDSI